MILSYVKNLALFRNNVHALDIKVDEFHKVSQQTTNSIEIAQKIVLILKPSNRILRWGKDLIFHFLI